MRWPSRRTASIFPYTQAGTTAETEQAAERIARLAQMLVAESRPPAPVFERGGVDDPGSVVLKLADGWELRSGICDHGLAAVTCGEWVSLHEPGGREYAYWDQSEWQAEPVLVMGAIISSAAGYRVLDTGEEVTGSQTAGEPAISELVAFAEKLGISEDELDEYVHDVSSRAGSSVNNEGMPGQIAYLAGALGSAETRRIIEHEVRDVSAEASFELRPRPADGDPHPGAVRQPSRQARDARREEFLAGVIVTAVEEGIEHWARIVEYRFTPAEQTLVIVRDRTDEASGRHRVNLNRVERAIQQIVTTDAGVIGGCVLREIARGNMNNDSTEVGPEAADAIIQVAVFGKVHH